MNIHSVENLIMSKRVLTAEPQFELTEPLTRKTSTIFIYLIFEA